MDHWEKIRHNQRIIERGQRVEVRIGEDAPRVTGYTREELEMQIRTWYHKLMEGLCRLAYHSPRGKVTLYALNMDGIVQLGSYLDMKGLGLGDVCDMLDRGRGINNEGG